MKLKKLILGSLIFFSFGSVYGGDELCPTDLRAYCAPNATYQINVTKPRRTNRAKFEEVLSPTVARNVYKVLQQELSTQGRKGLKVIVSPVAGSLVVKGTVNKDADTGQRSLTIYKVAEIPKGDVNGDLRKSPEDLNTVLCTLLTQQYPEVGCQCPALAKYAPPETSVTMADVKVFYDSFTNNRERLTEVTCGQQGLKIIINVQ